MAGAFAAQTVGVYASAARPQITLRSTRRTIEFGFGSWQRVSRLGIPLINETVIGLQDKDFWNRTDPEDDAPIFGAYFDNLIAARDAQAVGYYGTGAPLNVCNIQNGGPPLTNRLADLVPVINLAVDGLHTMAKGQAITSVGDVLRVDLGMPMSDFPNGRRLVAGQNYESVDVVDTEIKLLFCTLTNAAVNTALGPDTFGFKHNPYGAVPDGVSFNETNFRMTFPYLATPWQGFGAAPHAAPLD
jgi:hypothetical protein